MAPDALATWPEPAPLSRLSRADYTKASFAVLEPQAVLALLHREDQGSRGHGASGVLFACRNSGAGSWDLESRGPGVL